MTNSIWRRYIMWRTLRRHERHLRRLRKLRAILPKHPHHSTRRNGPECV